MHPWGLQMQTSSEQRSDAPHSQLLAASLFMLVQCGVQENPATDTLILPTVHGPGQVCSTAHGASCMSSCLGGEAVGRKCREQGKRQQRKQKQGGPPRFQVSHSHARCLFAPMGLVWLPMGRQAFVA